MILKWEERENELLFHFWLRWLICDKLKNKIQYKNNRNRLNELITAYCHEFAEGSLSSVHQTEL